MCELWLYEKEGNRAKVTCLGLFDLVGQALGFAGRRGPGRYRVTDTDGNNLARLRVREGHKAEPVAIAA